jgi:hypothetical protein
MKRLLLLLLLISTVFTLSSCGALEYKEVGYTINGYQVYEYDMINGSIDCDRISKWNLFVRDGENDFLTDYDFIDCRNTYYVKSGSSVLSLTDGIEEGLFTLEEVLAVDWDFEVYETYNFLSDIDASYFEFETDHVVVYDDLDNINRIKDISQSFYQKFIVGYSPQSFTLIGTIRIYDDNDQLLQTLDVYDIGIYIQELNAYQEYMNSEIYGLFTSVME